MTVQMVRFTTTPEHVPEIERRIAALVTALADEQPAGVRYAATKLSDGLTFMLWLELAEGVDENPLPAIPAAREFQQGLGAWTAAPPTPEPVTVVGSYRLLDGR